LGNNNQHTGPNKQSNNPMTAPFGHTIITNTIQDKDFQHHNRDLLDFDIKKYSENQYKN